MYLHSRTQSSILFGGNSHSVPACRVFLLTNDVFALKRPFKLVLQNQKDFKSKTILHKKLDSAIRNLHVAICILQ